MSYQTIKWLILVLPTIIIGLWEYVRHAFLLPYISMDLGNVLSPVILFIVTITLTRKLFLIYERMQEEVRMERARKAVLEERERLVRQLHDGLAQSLFLLSVQIDQMEGKTPTPEQWNEMKKTVRRIHDYTRQAMSNLKTPLPEKGFSWTQMMRQMAEQFSQETHVPATVSVDEAGAAAEAALSAKERVALSACLQEALMNVRKHAKAQRVDVFFGERDGCLCLVVEDDGVGFVGEPWNDKDKFGLHIMRERAQEIGWNMKLERDGSRTRLTICRSRLEEGGESNGGSHPNSHRR
ncbi:MAG: hypothetical protein A6D91_04135 [Bacillaceae bacterium G1]|nr:MAG: hypothetical protein A6D91_04135 [Bacillaceae bacterium G1]